MEIDQSHAGGSSRGSFSVSITTGVWADFATDDRGGDLVSLYAYLFTGVTRSRRRASWARGWGPCADRRKSRRAVLAFYGGSGG